MKYKLHHNLIFLTLTFLVCIIMTNGKTFASPIPIIHQSDLYDPQIDPDDHWDLATVYALDNLGLVDLKGVVIEYPPTELNQYPAVANAGDPSACAIGQMNWIISKAVPFATGSSKPYSDDPDFLPNLSEKNLFAAKFMIDILNNSSEPVAILNAGSCRDIAIAIKTAPEVFKNKCLGIYLCAGTGTTDPSKGANEEWNVQLDRKAYRAALDAPCPIYWTPCFYESNQFKTEKYASYWNFKQAEILPHLPPPVQNYFLYAFSRQHDPHWLRYVTRDVDQNLLETFSEHKRNMWCTAGFIHIAATAINKQNPKTIPTFLAENEKNPVFTYKPISITRCEKGVKNWQQDPTSKDRYIIEVNDVDRFPGAMTRALKELLTTLK